MPVSRLEITSQQPFAEGQSFGDVGSYTQVDGIAHFAVDPHASGQRDHRRHQARAPQ